MFSKAKLKRFNEEVGCAPPPTAYDPKVKQPNSASHFNRCQRFKDPTEVVPAPNCYETNDTVFSVPRRLSPSKKSVSHSSRLNSSSISSCSEASSHGNGIHLTPSYQTPFMRSRSFKHPRSSLKKEKSHDNNTSETLMRLENEKQKLKAQVEKLQQELANHKKIIESSPCQFKHASTQVEAQNGNDFENYVEQIHPEDLSVKRSDTACGSATISVMVSDHHLMQDQMNHLTSLRDNLEESILNKEEIIAELQMKIDQVVVEAQEAQNEVHMMKQMLDKSIEERSEAESMVKSLVKKYEAMANEQKLHEQKIKNEIAQKDVEIELLNDSIATLNTIVSEYELTISRIQSEASFRLSQISSLEITVEDLSIVSKEKEVMETVLEDEIKEKSKEVNKLEETMESLESKLRTIVSERAQLISSLEEEKETVSELKKQVESFEVKLKEHAVLQQFLEKEVSSREAEVSQSGEKMNILESELEMINAMALDLQSETESKLNEIFSLKASLSAKDYDIEERDDTVKALRKEINEKVAKIAELESEMSKHEKSAVDFEHTVSRRSSDIEQLKVSLEKAQENTSQLEQKVVELMAEISDRESEYKRKFTAKDYELEDVSLKYSETILQVDSLKRNLADTTEVLEKEKLVVKATESKLDSMRKEWIKRGEEVVDMEASMMDLTIKLTHMEDALSSEEAESCELQRCLEEATETLEKVEHENQTMRDSNSGFQARIVMLRTDMHKKAVAVEESQNCIDMLREERTQLFTSFSDLKKAKEERDIMLDDLQKEFESSLKAISELGDKVDSLSQMLSENTSHLEEATRMYRMKDIELEELMARLSDVEGTLMGEEDEKAEYKTKSIELGDQLEILKEEKQITEDRLKNELEEQKIMIGKLEVKLQEKDSKYDVYEDQLNNMQTLLAEKSSLVDTFEQSFLEESHRVQMSNEAILSLTREIFKLKSDTECLNKSILEKDEQLSTLNKSFMVQSQQVPSLQAKIEEKQAIIDSLQEKLTHHDNEIETIKKKDSDAQNMVKINEKIISELENKIRTVENDKLSTIEVYKCQVSELQGAISNIMRELSETRDEATMWEHKLAYLEKMIEPFREQLDAFEVERSSLLSKSSQDTQKINELSEEYTKLLGHRNHKQKVQHVVKLKEENNKLREESVKYRTECEHQRKLVKRLQERVESLESHQNTSVVSKGRYHDGSTRPKQYTSKGSSHENKENTPMDLPRASSTPLRSSNRMPRI